MIEIWTRFDLVGSYHFPPGSCYATVQETENNNHPDHLEHALLCQAPVEKEIVNKSEADALVIYSEISFCYFHYIYH